MTKEVECVRETGNARAHQFAQPVGEGRTRQLARQQVGLMVLGVDGYVCVTMLQGARCVSTDSSM